jgi:hypothetical protein
MPETRQPTVAPLDQAVDHVRGPAAAPLILEYGDYECPDTRAAFRQIERVEHELGGAIRFAFDGSVHRGGYDAATLMDALGR